MTGNEKRAMNAPVPKPEPRSLHVIAADIREDWGDPYYAAIPYLRAMACLTTMQDMYMNDSAASVVRYFLRNARTWKGETARRIKAELKGML